MLPTFNPKLIKVSLITLTVLLVLGLIVPIVWIKYRYSDEIISEVDKLESYKVGVVFGAAVWQNQQPSHALEDRLLTAVDLYQADKIEKLIMTGDNGHQAYNEPQVMKNYVTELGVDPDDVILDYAGFRTYDSCYRLHSVFGQEQAVLITQEFHLPRAIYTCEGLGVDVVGFKADKRILRDQPKNELRELFASWLAWWQINISHPPPRFLGEPIEIN